MYNHSTPPPWSKRGYDEVVCSKGRLIATIAKRGKTEIESDNHNLIAGAPELLEALDAVSRIFGKGYANTSLVEWDAAYGKVLAGLAKAKGEDNGR